jgi:hypothetical protein
VSESSLDSSPVSDIILYINTALWASSYVSSDYRPGWSVSAAVDSSATGGGFANENSLLKLLYAGILKASERWTHPVQNWNLTLSQMAIHFPGRLEHHISL